MDRWILPELLLEMVRVSHPELPACDPSNG